LQAASLNKIILRKKNNEIKILYSLVVFNGILPAHSLFGSLKEKLKHFAGSLSALEELV